MTARLSARGSALALIGLVCASALGLAACDDAIDTPDSLRGTYTLWGALDPTSAVQSVRVVPVTDTVGLGSTAPLPVTVVSVDLATGAEAAWRDSVVVFSNGGVGHVYRAAFRPAYGSRHRVVVRRDGGGEVSAVVAVPPYVEPVFQATRLSGGVQYPVLWPGAPQLNRARVTYTVQSAATCAVETVTRDFGVSGPVEFGWQTVIDLGAEAQVIREALGPQGLVSIQITAEVASEDWRPPGGVFDPEVLAEPNALGNVSGGFGFVGAAYDVATSIRPTFSELAATAFVQTNC